MNLRIRSADPRSASRPEGRNWASRNPPHRRSGKSCRKPKFTLPVFNEIGNATRPARPASRARRRWPAAASGSGFGFILFEPEPPLRRMLSMNVMELLEESLAVWRDCPESLPSFDRSITPAEQMAREAHLQRFLDSVQSEMHHAPASRAERQSMHRRLTEALTTFGRAA